MRETRGALISLLSLLPFFALSSDCLGEEPGISALLPARVGETLQCAVRTRGIPSVEAVRSMEGGLPSSVDLHFRLVDDRSRSLFQNQVSFRIAFDLWDEIFRVEGPISSRRFDTLSAVEQFLAGIESIPVAPWSLLDSAGIYRIEVEMIHHAIAPAETGRISEWISGDRSGVTGDPGSREVSFGLGRMIRFFYREGREEEGSVVRVMSDPFQPGELTYETP